MVENQNTFFSTVLSTANKVETKCSLLLPILLTGMSILIDSVVEVASENLSLCVIRGVHQHCMISSLPQTKAKPFIYIHDVRSL